ncbi:MAG: dephospho-CoA kinase [Acidimicrobiales bacterium]
MIVVGLTGGIGSGKSSVSTRLAALGAVVIDADAITREVQAPGQPVLAAMVGHFGDGILQPDGQLDRQAVADRVFGDADALAELNKIVHPAVGLEIATRMAAEAETGHVVILDVPLLVESGRDDLAATIVVDVDPELALQRLVDQRGMRPDDARARMARQASREDRLARADFVIDNSGSLPDLDRQVAALWPKLLDLAPVSTPD